MSLRTGFLLPRRGSNLQHFMVCPFSVSTALRHNVCVTHTGTILLNIMQTAVPDHLSSRSCNSHILKLATAALHCRLREKYVLESITSVPECARHRRNRVKLTETAAKQSLQRSALDLLVAHTQSPWIPFQCQHGAPQPRGAAEANSTALGTQKGMIFAMQKIQLHLCFLRTTDTLGKCHEEGRRDGRWI